MDFESYIRDIPDWPKEGVMFKDITPLLANPEVFKATIDTFAAAYAKAGVTKVMGAEARGFIFGGALAYCLGAGFVPARKPGKLPWNTKSVSYDLEYGTDTLEMHQDAVGKGSRVLIVDDLLATGGTAAAAARMVRDAGGTVVGIGFVVELTFLNGRRKLAGYDVFSLLEYDS